ncbi:MAG: 5-dehydro-2-deoxygluconokinase [Alphaproteobacteria bacterium]
MPGLDVITIGRSSVDLYGQQIGGRLEDMGSFAKSVGGCPANIAIGAARLGLKSALITRVGDEPMGRFITEQLEREGVLAKGVVVDPHRLTALVILGVRDDATFPLVFYRENCADMALCEGDIDPALIRSAKAIVVSGTHFSTPTVEAASREAMRIARDAGGKIVFDIDYRPNLWGLAGHDAGEERFVASAEVSARLQSILPDCDLVVGTEEEFHIAAGATDTPAALRRVRELSQAVIVCKRGPMGCLVFPGAIPESIEDGIRGAQFAIEVYNVLGAGDAFMAGFLRGWLRGEPLETCATWANACGAFTVSRLMCSREIPTWDELTYFLENGSTHHALRHDEAINHLHRVTTRRGHWDRLMTLAFDHRAQFEEMADRLGVSRDKIGPFKRLAVQAAAKVADGRPGFGILCDGKYGRQALFDAAGRNLWIGRPVEEPGSRPLRFEPGRDLGSHLVEWPVTHVVKCQCFYHPGDPESLRLQQEETLLALHEASRAVGRELLVEIVAGKRGEVRDDTVSGVLARLYSLGIKPDWWKLEPQATQAAWRNIEAVIRDNDPWCRGIVMLGLDAPEEDLIGAFEIAAASRMVKGFAVGRTIFAATAERWLAGKIDDATAVDDMAARFSNLVRAWESATSVTAA